MGILCLIIEIARVVILNEGLVVCVRGIISFFTLLIFTRLLGKQQLGQITFFDYILGITIGSFAASLTVDLSSSAWPHWIGILTWIVLGVLLQKVSLISRKISHYINDEPIIVVHNGKIMGDNLRSSKFTIDELLQQLRLKSIFDINEVKLAMIETNGQLSILKTDEFQSMISCMGFSNNEPEINNELIFDGIIIRDNLLMLNHDNEWLLKQLKKCGISNPAEVFYAFMNSHEELDVISFRDKVISSKDIFK